MSLILCLVPTLSLFILFEHIFQILTVCIILNSTQDEFILGRTYNLTPEQEKLIEDFLDLPYYRELVANYSKIGQDRALNITSASKVRKKSLYVLEWSKNRFNSDLVKIVLNKKFRKIILKNVFPVQSWIVLCPEKYLCVTNSDRLKPKCAKSWVSMAKCTNN